MMKKTVLHLVLLVIGFMMSQYSYGQKKKIYTYQKNKSTVVDSFYFETPNSQTQSFILKDGGVIDSVLFSPNTFSYKSLFSAEETDFSLTRSIQLSNNSGSKAIPVEIDAGSPEFLLSINCNLQSGTLNVEIYDPKGIKRGNFSVKGSGHSNDKSGWSETVGGVINKRYRSPLEGTWTIKFISEKVSADISINTKIK